MNVIFLMSHIEDINPDKDTSLAFILSALRKGHSAFYVKKGNINYTNGNVTFSAQKLTESPRAKIKVTLSQPTTLQEEDIDAVMIRTDPPFDTTYLRDTLLLDLMKQPIPILNRPQGIRDVNEKLWAIQFSSLVPPTIVSSQKSDFIPFLQKHKTIIAKPIDGFGGSSIFKISDNDPNRSVIFETLSKNSTERVILQSYIKESSQGDKRVILLNGDPIGTLMRVHSKEEFRNNFFAGGQPEPASLTKRDLEIIDTIKPYLKKKGLNFVGIDIIGNYLIEVNVTSPTCINEINKLNGTKIEDDVITYIEEQHHEKT